MVKRYRCHLRLFLFQTALASGADAGFPPLTRDDNLDPAPGAVFAISRGFELLGVEAPGGGVLELGREMSPAFAVAPGVVTLDARNFLLTDTALNVAGFLIDEPARLWPFSSSLPCLDPSAREASVSEPPLTLASVGAEESSMFVMCLFSISP